MRTNDALSIDRYFVQKMFRRQYVPALAAALTLSFGDVADALVLGNRMGLTGLAAIALVMPVGMVFNILMNGLGIGGSVFFSRKMAQGREEEALDGFQGVVVAAFGLGLAIAVLGNVLYAPLLRILGASPGDGELYRAALTYMRILLLAAPAMFLNYVFNYYLKADDMERQASLAFAAGNVLDISLNVILVLVLDMGVAGASLATMCGQTLGMLISIWAIQSHQGVLELHLFHADLSEVGAAFRTGFSTSVEYLYEMFFLGIANNVLIRLSGDVGVAVFDVVLNVSYFSNNLYDAAVKSALPIISTFDGEHNVRGKHLVMALALQVCLLTDLPLCGILWAVPERICRVFGLTGPSVIAVGVDALRWFATGVVFAGISILLENYYEACRKEREAYVLSSLRGAVILIPATLIFSSMGLGRFWLVYPVTEGLALAAFFLWRERFGTKDSFPEERAYRRTITSRTSEITDTAVEIEEFCERWEAAPAQQYFMSMSVEEICVATLQTGFGGMEDGFIQITLIALEDGTFELHVRDNAAFFNPFSLESEKVSSVSGVDLDALGVMAIKKKARDFYYRNHQGFNTVIFRI